MRITHSQAIDAVQIIVGLVEQIEEEDGLRPCAVELRLGPNVVEEMRDVVNRIRANDRGGRCDRNE